MALGLEKTDLIQNIDTGLFADSVEWCPLQGLEHILLCGTYQLADNSSGGPQSQLASDSGKQIRDGGVSVFSLTFGDGGPRLEQQGKLDMCGVLDIKWPDSKIDDSAVCGLVDAEGHCQLLSVAEDRTVEKVAKSNLGDECLGLSLSFSSFEQSGKLQVAASDSTGSLTVLDVSRDLQPTLNWHAHDYEAWITAFHKFDNNLVFSGGDDCRLKGWDVRDTSRPAFVSKRHQMGVCSIQSHPFEENIFASGSYDEEVNVWDRRTMKTPITSSSIGGGVWRIKWNPYSGSQILTATMYNGTHIVDYKRTDDSLMPIVGEHGGHNLAYGADWCRLDPSGELLNCLSDTDTSCPLIGQSYLIATCSFYDHSLHLWNWSCEK